MKMEQPVFKILLGYFYGFLLLLFFWILCCPRDKIKFTVMYHKYPKTCVYIYIYIYPTSSSRIGFYIQKDLHF